MEEHERLTNLHNSIAKLRSLHDGDLGVVETIACGPMAVPQLRAMLFEREPSGLFETRCRVVQVLAALRAHDVLVDFLKSERKSADPVERLGDDAVINAAARAVAMRRTEDVFLLLLTLAKDRLLPGVVAGLGSFRRHEAIPYLIAALAEDECRPLAEAALKALGSAAYPALLQAAFETETAPGHESPSRLRQRRSISALLGSADQSGLEASGSRSEKPKMTDIQ